MPFRSCQVVSWLLDALLQSLPAYERYLSQEAIPFSFVYMKQRQIRAQLLYVNKIIYALKGLAAHGHITPRALRTILGNVREDFRHLRFHLSLLYSQSKIIDEDLANLAWFHGLDVNFKDIYPEVVKYPIAIAMYEPRLDSHGHAAIFSE